MSNVLQIKGSLFALRTGFFNSQEKSPVNKLWDMYLPVKGADMEISYSQICQVIDKAVLFCGVQFDFIMVEDRDYTGPACYAIQTQLRRLPTSEKCVLSVPSRILWDKRGS